MAWFTSKRTSRSTTPKAPRAPSGAKAARVAEYLSEHTIRLFPAAKPWAEAVADLVGTLGLADPAAALAAIQAREAAGSTVIAPGLGLPHARLPGLPRLAAALGVCPPGFSQPSGAPIHVGVVFLSPKEQTRDHLAFLAGVSALFQTEGFLEALVHCSSAEMVLARLRDAESAR